MEEAAVGTTIADIARLFGCANSGRFSTHYRNEYGEPPSATLHRVRSSGTADSAPADGAQESTLLAGDAQYGEEPADRPGRGAVAASDAIGR